MMLDSLVDIVYNVVNYGYAANFYDDNYGRDHNEVDGHRPQAG